MLRRRSFAVRSVLTVFLVYATTLRTDGWASGYRIIDLGTLGARFNRACRITSTGLVVGYTYAGGVDTGPFVSFPPYDSIQALPLLPAYQTYLQTASSANAEGVIVGMTQAPNYGMRAVRWTNMQPVELPPLAGYGDAAAADINDDGVITGLCWRGPRTTTAVRWIAGVPQELPTLAQGDQNSAGPINKTGVIAGYCFNASGLPRAVVWNLDGSLTDLGVLDGDQRSWASGINDAGDVVGFSRNPQQDRGVLWRAGRAQDLSPMCSAFGINNHGVIVGYDTDRSPAIWNNGQITKLPLLPLEEPWGVAVDIDENGVIVGFVAGLVDSLPAERAVVWMPAPVQIQQKSLSDVKALYRR